MVNRLLAQRNFEKILKIDDFDKLLAEYDDYIFREKIADKFNSSVPPDKQINPINFNLFDEEMEALNQIEKALLKLHDEV